MKTRLDALEAKRKPSEPMAIFIIPAEQEESVVGFVLDGATVALREQGETLEELQARAAATAGRGVAIFRPCVEV